MCAPAVRQHAAALRYARCEPRGLLLLLCLRDGTLFLLFLLLLLLVLFLAVVVVLSVAFVVVVSAPPSGSPSPSLTMRTSGDRSARCATS